MIIISVIIVSYNTEILLSQCLDAVNKVLKKSGLKGEIIVVDNASSDNTKNILIKFKKKISNLKLIFNKKNFGYSHANNQGIKIARGKYVLFLNSDVLVNGLNLNKLIEYLDNHIQVGALTTKVVFPDNHLDMASHRGFPTPWRSFCYLIGLEKIFGRLPILSLLFGGYHLLSRDFNSIHPIDAITGAFFLTRREIINQVGGFDEDFFMYGEDLDLCWRIKEKGYQIMFYPKEKVIHYKYQSGLKSVDSKIKKQTKKFFYQAMKIFYKKHYASSYPRLFNYLIYQLIDIFENIKNK